MRSSSLNLLKQAEKNPKKVLKKLNELEEKVKESPKDVISINDPDARLMKNKKGIAAAIPFLFFNYSASAASLMLAT